MAVYRISEKRADYFGYSSDTKPVVWDGKDLPNGTTFVDLDTGARFIFFNGTWEEDLTLIYALSEALKQ